MAGQSDSLPHANPEQALNSSAAHELDESLIQNQHSLSGTEYRELISGLIDLVRKNGTRRTLSQIHAHLLVQQFLKERADQERADSNPRGEELTPDQDPGLPPQLVQFGIGVALMTDSQTSTPISFRQFAAHLFEVKNWFSRRRSTSLPLDSPEVDPFFEMAWRELTTLRHVNGEQLFEKAYRAYKPWEKEMEEMLGFSIEDAIFFSNNIVEGINPQFAGMREEVASWSNSLLDFSEKAIKKTDELVWLEKSELYDWCFKTDRFDSFLNRMSVEPGSVTNFTNPMEINPLEKSPFVKYKTEYLLPAPRSLPRSLATTFYYDLMGSDYRGQFQLEFGDWLEDWAVDCLEKLFPRSQILRNYKYTVGGEQVEGDILVISDDGVLVIECKGKKLRAETRMGEFGGIDEIKEDIRKGIGHAYEQADRLLRGVISGEVEKVHSQKGEIIELNQDDIEDAQRWILLGESYGAIATRDYAKILDVNPVPYVCDIFDLQVMAEALHDSSSLLKYINQRTRQTEVQIRYRSDQYPNTGTFSSDEIDYLAVFKRNGGQFPPKAERITGAGDLLREESIERLRDSKEFQFVLSG